jgi:predicted glycoside hydrolase/deacetylase ChbG (UPF0249 family)
MAKERWLIVNADDLGLSAGTNRGIFEAHEHGIVTSASLMVNRPAAPEAVDQSRDYPRLSVGLHVDVGDWLYQDGQWRQTLEIVPANDPAQVRAEFLRQLRQFEKLTGRTPTHIDSHHNVHRHKTLRRIFIETARVVGVSLRGFSPTIAYCGDFYGQDRGRVFLECISTENLCRIIRELSEGITELACHPGFDSKLDTDYREERAREVRTLCDPQVRAELEREGVVLRSFADLAPDRN